MSGGAKAVMVESGTAKYISIRDLEESDDKSVFVVNSTTGQSRGDVLFAVSRLNGSGSDPVRVVKTWIPQDLTEQVPKSQLLADSNFRKTVSKGMIRIVNPAYALKTLKLDTAIVEKARIENERSAAQAALKASMVTRQDNKTPAQLARDAKREEAEAQSGGIDGYENRFTRFMQTLEGKNEIEVLNAIRNEGGFTKQQIQALKNSFEKFPRVISQLNKMLAKAE